MSLDSNTLRIVYMGTPEFAVAPLQALHDSGFNIVGIVTVADKPAGRGRKLQQSPVKTKAIELGISILQPTNLKEERFVSQLRALNADLFVVVAFRMLPEQVWMLPRLGTFNLHGSLLPKYRGAAPLHWAVINGERQTGLTTFLLDKMIDTGGILLQQTIDIEENMTTGELHDALLPIGASMVVDTVQGLMSNELSPTKQLELHATHAPKLNKENSELDFRRSPQELINQIHGLNPFPGAHYSGYKFLKALRCDEHFETNFPQLSVREKHLFLDYPNGSIEIIEIKPSGKRNMSGKDFANGLNEPFLSL